MTIHITVAPIKTTAKGQRYEVRLDGEVVTISRTPFLSAARVLLGRGHSSESLLTMRHAGERVVALSARLGVAAGLTVVESGSEAPRFSRYRAHPEEMARAAVCNRPRTVGPGLSGRVAYAGSGASR